jgi:xylulokinase
MNLKVDTVEVEEGPAYGGAILAAVADGTFADVEQAVAKIVRIKDTTEPDAALVQKYEECYQKFVKMYPALKDTFQNLV